ncbi:hypothetical protein C2E31_07570 [Rhodopirellula baltica]|nr:hypothetical protein C2E31_07570 [Rhodopirellula baltica]
MRSIAAAIGLTVGVGIALDATADEPAKWNSFKMPSTDLKTVMEGLDAPKPDADQIQQVAMQGAVQNIPAPIGRPVSPMQVYPPSVMYPQAPTGQPYQGYAAPSSQYQAPQGIPQPTMPTARLASRQMATQQVAPRQFAPRQQTVTGQYVPTQRYVSQPPMPELNAPHFGATHYSVGHQQQNVPTPAAPMAEAPMVSQPQAVPHTQVYSSPYSDAVSAPWQGAPYSDYESGACGGPMYGGACDQDSCNSGSCNIGSYGQSGCSAPGCSMDGCTGGCGGGCTPTGCGDVGAISPWYGGTDILFWELAGGSNAVFATYDNAVAVGQYNYLNPGNTAGFNTRIGRYLGCGAYGIDVGFLYWDPDPQSRMYSDTGAGLRFTLPALNTVSINRGGGATTVYDDYDMNAACICAERDIRVKGIEINLNCFGLMGARRLGSAYPSSIFAGCGLGGNGGCGLLGGCGLGGGCGPYRASQRSRLYGSAIGPLARACSGRVRVRTSHGFRWFQLEDDLLIAGDVDGMPGLGGSDIYYELHTENNLYGYQFGSQLSYAIGCRLMLNVGGKVGIYGNDARVRHWIGNDMVMAYTDSQGAGAGDLYSDKSDVNLAGLGELDFGLGYRICNRFTATCGYRVLTACGVATSIGSMPAEYTSVESAGRVRADDCLMMHGGYVGFNYNW